MRSLPWASVTGALAEALRWATTCAEHGWPLLPAEIERNHALAAVVAAMVSIDETGLEQAIEAYRALVPGGFDGTP